MDALKILIVEDDLILAERIADDLSELGYIITDNVTNSVDALKAFRKKLPDLAILDIDLEESSWDGIEIAHKFNELVKIPIIFLTGIGGASTVKRAQKANPAYYLIKPYNITQLSISIDFAINNYTNKLEADVKHSLQFHSSPSCTLYSSKDFFFAKKGTKYIRVEVEDIIYIKGESPGNNVRIVTEVGSLFLSAGLKSFSQQIPHQSLLRLNRSYVVNVNKIVAFDAGRVFVEINGEQKEIPIGVTYRDSIQEIFTKLKAD